MRILGRPTHRRNLQELIEEHRRTLPHGSSFELREFAVWAIREGRWAPPIKSAVWNDITTAPPEHMLASLQHRRMGIADDCWQLKQDLDSYDDNWNPGERIQIWFDFMEDMEERELSAHYPSAYFDEEESAEETAE
jgi:hypothetical protein